jgi:predicted RND superfamily exporter protein
MEHQNFANNGHKMIAAIYSEEDFVPKNQQRKIAVLRNLHKALPTSIVQRLDLKDRRQVESFLEPEAFHPFAVKDLPNEVRERFKENDGTIGKIILVEPVLDSSVINDGDNETILMNRLRSVVDSVSPGTPIAGQIPLTVDMYQAVRKEGPKSTAVAFVAVFILMILIFRHFRTVALAVTALLLGVTWFFGMMFAADLRINFLNFIALPITFGIGVDYGVNIFQRYRQEGTGSILEVIRNNCDFRGGLLSDRGDREPAFVFDLGHTEKRNNFEKRRIGSKKVRLNCAK